MAKTSKSPIPRPLIVGNWKMNGLRAPAVSEIKKLLKLLAKAAGRAPEVAICPPATLVATLAGVLKTAAGGRRLGLGGQDCHASASGAHTGDLSAEMLKDAGAAFVIVGHSERRTDHGESSNMVREKAAAAHRAGIAAIICLGESLAEREAGRTLDVLRRQLEESVPAGAKAANTAIAYEPIWAIGTGRTPTEAQIVEVHTDLRRQLTQHFADGGKFRLLYGGSVKPENAAAILGLDPVNGALVGGASLKAADFWRIISARM